MTKKLIMALVATLTICTLTPTSAQADSIPTIAILDTAIDTSLPIFKDKIVHEVCILEWMSCPNGKNFQEGPGSAVMPANLISKNGFEHGTSMASVVVNTNPNVNIVFIRIIGATSTGVRQSTNETTLVNALNWVIANKQKFNIQAVSMSQSHHNLMPGSDYCPSTTKTITAIQSLIALDVPTFFPSGNTRDYVKIDWPACLTDSVSIGATDQYGAITIYSNADIARLDFYALGNMKVSVPGGKTINGAGTSIATQVAAANYISIKTAKSSLSSSQILDLMSRTSIPTRNSKVSTGKLIYLQGALNG